MYQNRALDKALHLACVALWLSLFWSNAEILECLASEQAWPVNIAPCVNCGNPNLPACAQRVQESGVKNNLVTERRRGGPAERLIFLLGPWHSGMTCCAGIRHVVLTNFSATISSSYDPSITLRIWNPRAEDYHIWVQAQLHCIRDASNRRSQFLQSPWEL